MKDEDNFPRVDNLYAVEVLQPLVVFHFELSC